MQFKICFESEEKDSSVMLPYFYAGTDRLEKLKPSVFERVRSRFVSSSNFNPLVKLTYKEAIESRLFREDSKTNTVKVLIKDTDLKEFVFLDEYGGGLSWILNEEGLKNAWKDAGYPTVW